MFSQEKVYYEERHPIRVFEHCVAHFASSLAQVDRNNIELLSIIHAQDSKTNLDMPSDSAVSRELISIDQKLSFLIGLVGQYISKQEDVPEATTVKMNNEYIEWYDVEKRDLGQEVEIQLFLAQNLFRPLIVYGCISASNETPLGIVSIARYSIHNEELAELIEKMIFRSHRRKVFQAKQ